MTATEEQLAEAMFLDVHPGDDFAEQPWETRSQYYHSASLVRVYNEADAAAGRG
jgi:hypothetical protein